MNNLRFKTGALGARFKVGEDRRARRVAHVLFQPLLLWVSSRCRQWRQVGYVRVQWGDASCIDTSQAGRARFECIRGGARERHCGSNERLDHRLSLFPMWLWRAEGAGVFGSRAGRGEARRRGGGPGLSLLPTRGTEAAAWRSDEAEAEGEGEGLKEKEEHRGPLGQLESTTNTLTRNRTHTPCTHTKNPILTLVGYRHQTVGRKKIKNQSVHPTRYRKSLAMERKQREQSRGRERRRTLYPLAPGKPGSLGSLVTVVVSLMEIRHGTIILAHARA